MVSHVDSEKEVIDTCTSVIRAFIRCPGDPERQVFQRAPCVAVQNSRWKWIEERNIY